MKEKNIKNHTKKYSNNLIVILLLCSLMSFMFIGLVNAEADVKDFGTVKQNSQLSIIMTCGFTNGSSCSSTAQCNVTSIQYPNQSLVIADKIMTRNGPNFNLTVPTTDTIGPYNGNQRCCDAGLCGDEAFKYYVSASGFSDMLGLSIIIILAIYAIAFIGFFGKSEWVTIIGGLGMMMLGLYCINFGIDVYRNFITDAFAWLTIGLGAFFAILAGVEIIEENLK